MHHTEVTADWMKRNRATSHTEGDDLLMFESTTMTAKPIASYKAKDFLIKRLQLNKGNLVLLVAAGGSGKSMFMQYLGLCVSTGSKLFDTFDVKQGKVLHIDQEQSENQTSLRYSRIAKAMGVSDFNIERIYLKSRLDAVPDMMQLVEDRLVAKFKGYDLVLVDSLKKLSVVDENSSEIEKVCNLLKRAAERANCVIMLIHHKGKGKVEGRQSGRGHSSIYDSCDVQIDLDHESGDQEPFELECTKNRDGRIFQGLKYSMEDRGDFLPSQDCQEELAFSLIQEVSVNKVDDYKTSMLKVLAAGECILSKLYEQITAKGGRDMFDTVLADCLSNKLVIESVGHKRSRLFTITDNGRAFVAYSGVANV